jgi:hypothetical protein
MIGGLIFRSLQGKQLCRDFVSNWFSAEMSFRTGNTVTSLTQRDEQYSQKEQYIEIHIEINEG